MERTRIKISVIIVNWNTKDLLKQCLESLIADLTFNKISNEIIVVDNNSSDGSVEMVKKMFPSVRLICNKQNLGYAKGNNKGIKNATGEYIMILNTDTIIKQGAIKKLVGFLDREERVDIVGPKILNQDGTPQSSCGRFPNLAVCGVMLFKEHFGGSKFVRWSPSESVFVDWVIGAAFIARKKIFEKIGGFDENIFMYMEEVEWFYRAKKAGFKVYFLKDAEIIHLGRGSSKSGKTQPILNIYKGLIYFYKKHKTFPELFVLKLMLKTKALGAYLLGLVKNDKYLKETYGEAFKIN